MEKIKIIILENDEDEQDFMKEGFEESGYFEIIAFADSGEELLEYLYNHNNPLPDLLLSDLNMPGKNGYDILRELRADKRFSNLPIIITSTSSLKMVVDTCMQLGATKFIKKPETFVDYGRYAKELADTIINP